MLRGTAPPKGTWKGDHWSTDYASTSAPIQDVSIAETCSCCCSIWFWLIIAGMLVPITIIVLSIVVVPHSPSYPHAHYLLSGQTFLLQPEKFLVPWFYGIRFHGPKSQSQHANSTGVKVCRLSKAPELTGSKSYHETWTKKMVLPRRALSWPYSLNTGAALHYHFTSINHHALRLYVLVGPVEYYQFMDTLPDPPARYHTVPFNRYSEGRINMTLAGSEIFFVLFNPDKNHAVPVAAQFELSRVQSYRVPAEAQCCQGDCNQALSNDAAFLLVAPTASDAKDDLEVPRSVVYEKLLEQYWVTTVPFIVGTVLVICSLLLLGCFLRQRQRRQMEKTGAQLPVSINGDPAQQHEEPLLASEA